MRMRYTGPTCKAEGKGAPLHLLHGKCYDVNASIRPSGLIRTDVVNSDLSKTTIVYKSADIFNMLWKAV